MPILEDARNSFTVWRAISRLNSPVADERLRAMKTLREIGSNARWQLRIAAKNKLRTNSQLGSALVLHWLEDPLGMEVLLFCLKERLPEESELAQILEYAFIAIGSPAAVEALLGVWRSLVDTNKNAVVRTTICRVWVKLGDPVVLEALVSDATRFPMLFETTVPSFGVSALPCLEKMSVSANPQVRMIAIRTLREILIEKTVPILVKMLEDPDLAIRSEAPRAIVKVGWDTGRIREHAVREITKALANGYSSVPAIRFVLEINPPELLTILLTHIQNWADTQPARSQSDAALILTLQTLEGSMMLPFQFIPAIIQLLPKLKSQEEISTAIRALGRHGTMQTIKPTLLTCLSSPIASVREEVATILARDGDNFGTVFLHFLETCKPQSSLMSRLSVALQGGPESGQAANQALQQMSTWFTRLSKEAADRLNLAPSGVKRPDDDPLLSNPRLSEHLRVLLVVSMKKLRSDTNSRDTEESIASCVTALRGIARLEPSISRKLRVELIVALSCQKRLINQYSGKDTGDSRLSD